MQVDDSGNKIVKEDKYFQYLNSLDKSIPESQQTSSPTKDFYYLTCETSKNSSIETVSSKNQSTHADELSKLDAILHSKDIKDKLKNIKMIIGEKAQSGVSSTLITPEDSRNG